MSVCDFKMPVGSFISIPFVENRKVEAKASELNELKKLLREYAQGKKFQLSFENLDSISISRPKPSEAKSVLEIDESEFEHLPETLKEELFERGVVTRKDKAVKERAAVIRFVFTR